MYLDPNVYGFAATDVNARTEAYANMAHFSLSNRWQLDNWSAGIEWFALNIPLGGAVSSSVSDLTDDENDKEDIRTAEDILTWYPSMAVTTVSLGYMF